MIDRDPQHLHPLVREAARKTLEACERAGLPFRLFEGYRSPERQTALYAQGRTTPGRIVTYARAGESLHNYGLAVDIVGFVGGAWTWDLPQQSWVHMQAFGKTYGLRGLSFEMPHLEWPVNIAELRAGVFPAGGDATWQAVVRVPATAAPVAPKPEVTPALSDADRLNQAELDRVRGA